MRPRRTKSWGLLRMSKDPVHAYDPQRYSLMNWELDYEARVVNGKPGWLRDHLEYVIIRALARERAAYHPRYCQLWEAWGTMPAGAD